MSKLLTRRAMVFLWCLAILMTVFAWDRWRRKWMAERGMETEEEEIGPPDDVEREWYACVLGLKKSLIGKNSPPVILRQRRAASGG